MKKKLKSALSLLLCMIMVFGALAVGGEGIELPSIKELFGSEAQAASEKYDIYTYEVGSDGTVTITDCDSSAQGAITIPSQIDGKPVTSIGDYAFNYCRSLTSITIPNSVIIIDYRTFKECGKLNQINIDTANTKFSSVNGVLFNKDKTALIRYPGGKTDTSYAIPDSVTSIGYNAFNGCTSLTSITIPDSVTSIGYNTFNGCTSLTSITIPDSVTSIGNFAFCGCTSLTSLTIPDSVTSIGGYAFNSTGIYNDESNWENDVLYIGNYLIEAKDTISGEYVIKSGTKCIATGAFTSCDSLTSITIPGSVTSIGGSMFRGCNSLTSVIIGDGVTRIDNDAFRDCSSLTSVTIPDSVTSIVYSAFAYCSSLTSITIPDSVTRIGSGAFEGCSSLTSITIPDSVTSIGYDAFNGCTSLTSVTIPDSVTSIEFNAFYGCDRLKAAYYLGTPEQWAEVSIGSENSCLTNHIVFKSNPDIFESESKLDITNGPIFIKKNEEYLISSNYYLNDEWQQAAEISWSSSDTSAAQIVKTSTGFGAFATVKGIADGVSTITATAPDGKTASCDIVVGNSMPYLSVETSSKELNIPYEGGKFSVISLLPGFEVGNWTNGFSGVYSDADKAKMTAKNVSLKIDLPDGLSFNKNSSQKSSTILNLGELTPGEKVNTSAEIFIYDLEARQNQIYMTLTLSCSNARLKVIPIKINIYEKGGKPINDMSPASIASDAGEKTINNNVETDDVMINKSTGIINVENAVHSYKDKLIVDGGTYWVYSGSTVSCSQIIVRSGELHINGSIDADSLKVEGGEVYINIDSNNRSVKIGEVKATGGVITINKGKFYADSISLKCRGLGTFIDKSGGVIEQNGGDIICKYDFLADSNLTSKLTAGRLWIGGDFKQTNSRHNFKCSDSHTTIFYGGGSHKINFDKTSKGNSYFHNCIVDNMYESKRDLCDYVKGEFRTAKTNITGLVFSSDGIDLNPVSKWEKGIVQLREQVAVIELRQDSTLTKIYDDDTLINLGQTVNMWLKLISSPLIKSNFDSVSEIGAEITFKNFEKKGYDLTFVASGASFGWWGSFSTVSWYCQKLGVPEGSPHVIGMQAGADTETFKNQAAIYLAKGAFSDLKSAYKKNAKKLAIEFAKEITADDYIEYAIETYDTRFKTLKTVSKYHKKLNKSPMKSMAVQVEIGEINYGVPVFSNATATMPRALAASSEKSPSANYGTFENAVKAVLNLNEINEQTALQFTSLDLSGCGIIDLSGIEKFTQLQKLILRDNYISDISPISNLKKLQVLDLSYNNIKNVDKLENMDLIQLNLSHNRIANIDKLSGNQGIEWADLSYNNITDFSGADWGSLKYLDISYNEIPSGWISFSSGYLTDLYADNCGLKSIVAVYSKKLVNISVVGNKLTSLGKRERPNLERADFSGNMITDMSALKNSKKLVSLDISDNALVDSDIVFNFDSLEVLNISNNAVTDMSIIKNAPKLKSLDISDNPLANIATINGNVSIDTLLAAGCGLTDANISAVGTMKSLKQLDLSNNSLTSASFVGSLILLESLDLTKNEIDFNSSEVKDILAQLSKRGTVIKEDVVSQSVTGIEAFDRDQQMRVSDKFSLSYFIYPSYATNQRVYWRSNNSSIASVDSNGYVTAKSAGRVIITATTADGGYSTTWTLNIKDKYCNVRWIVDDEVKITKEKVGSKITKPADPELEGYDFMGWSPEVPGTMPAHDMTFTAVFEPIKTKISINTPSVTTVSYGFTLNLHANVTDLPEGARIVWSMDGSGFELIPSADGMTCGVKSVSKGSATITAKVVDKNGNAVKDANGNEITASQSLTSKAGFFQKLVAFFKKLFGSNMVIPSSLNKLVK